jgi:hypothetical protein
MTSSNQYGHPKSFVTLMTSAVFLSSCAPLGDGTGATSLSLARDTWRPSSAEVDTRQPQRIKWHGQDETLIASGADVHVKNTQCGDKISTEFTVTGKAFGAFRGVFTASGGWSTNAGRQRWIFGETFSVAAGPGARPAVLSGSVLNPFGGSTKVRMGCRFFGPASRGDLYWTLSASRTGDVSTGVIRHGEFKESFYNGF